MGEPPYSIRSDMASAAVFRLARMSLLFKALTTLLFSLPLGFCVEILRGNDKFAMPFVLLVVIYAWVWLRFRPGKFVIHPDGLEVIWSFKCRQVFSEDITKVSVVDRHALRQETGWGIRGRRCGRTLGWLGWLWIKRRDIGQVYVLRTDRFVRIERTGDRPWLITPERPEAFVQALSGV